MISATSIRKAFKSAVFDPKDKTSEWYIMARDMSSTAHVARAKQYITFYLEGVSTSKVLLHAMWHLACGVAKLETVHSEKVETA